MKVAPAITVDLQIPLLHELLPAPLWISRTAGPIHSAKPVQPNPLRLSLMRQTDTQPKKSCLWITCGNGIVA